MDVGGAALLAGTGLAAGAVNTAAGGGSLLTFPALVATGHSTLVASVTNTVGLVTGYVGGIGGFRRELAGQGHRIQVLAIDAALGAAVGVVALLVAPGSVFDAVVPALLLVACGLLLLQPRLAAVLRRRAAAAAADGAPPRPEVPRALHLAVMVGAAYGAYFGAALGVLLLALLGLVLTEDLNRINALKGTVTLVTNLVAAVAYVVIAPVDWASAGVLAVSSPLGGYFGASLARRVPPPVLRLAVALVGLAAAAVLVVRQL